MTEINAETREPAFEDDPLATTQAGAHQAPVQSSRLLDNDGYFEDDRAVLDRSVSSEKDMGIIQQMDDVVTWRIDGFYLDPECTERKSRRELIVEPPVLVLQNAGATEPPYPILITPTVAEDLEKAFKRLNRGFRGLPEDDDEGKLTKDNAIKWFNQHKISSILIGLMLLFILLSQIFKF